MPRPQPARRFTLFDMMVLVAATAVGISLGDGYFRFQEGLSYLDSSEHARRGLALRAVFYSGIPTLATLTLALLPMRFVGPRQRFRRVLRSPGMTAGLVAALASAVALTRAALDWLSTNTIYGQHGPFGAWELVATRGIGLKDVVGLGVVFAWALLWVGGGWRPIADWVDRAGRCLGAVWIAAGVASWAFGLWASY